MDGEGNMNDYEGRVREKIEPTETLDSIICLDNKSWWQFTIFMRTRTKHERKLNYFLNLFF